MGCCAINYKNQAVDELFSILGDFHEKLPGFDAALKENFNLEYKDLANCSFAKLEQIVNHFEFYLGI